MPPNDEVHCEPTPKEVHGLRRPDAGYGPKEKPELQRAYVYLHSAFDLYFAEIAGYSSSIRSMRKKPRSVLLQIKGQLSRSFFERYKEFEQHRKLITPDETPDLYRQLTAAEQNRSDLLLLIDILVESADTTP